MDIKILRFSIYTFNSIVLLTTLIAIGSAKKIKVPDMNPISSRFADLLDSLVKVNVERVDALKKLFKLYDVGGTKQLLRSTLEDNYGENPELAFIFDNQEEYSEINKPTVHDKKRLCFCQDTNSDNEIALIDEFKERAVSRENPYSEKNLRYDNHGSSAEADKIIFLSIKTKQISNERNYSTDSSSQDEVISTPLKSGKRFSYKSKTCISPGRGYEDCKTSCKEAYGNACAEYHCGEYLYKQLRRECRHACKKRFKRPYDDYDYY